MSQAPKKTAKRAFAIGEQDPQKDAGTARGRHAIRLVMLQTTSRQITSALFCFLIGLSGTSLAAESVQKNGPQSDSQVPNLILGEDLRGLVSAANSKTIQILPLPKDKLASVVVFLSAKCPCSNSHVTELNSLAKEFPQAQFVAVHSNPDESLELARAYFQKSDLLFPAIQDDRLKLADQFKALKTPHAFVIDKTGAIVYRGGVTNSSNAAKATSRFLRDALLDLSQNRAVQSAMGRTLGCAISRELPPEVKK